MELVTELLYQRYHHHEMDSTDEIIYFLSMSWLVIMLVVFMPSVLPVSCLRYVTCESAVSPLNTHLSGTISTTGMGLSVKRANNTLIIIQNELFTFSQQYCIGFNYFSVGRFQQTIVYLIVDEAIMCYNTITLRTYVVSVLSLSSLTNLHNTIN